MNSIKNLKLIALGTCLCAGTILSSCDSDTPLSVSTDTGGDTIATSLDAPITDDTITFSSITGEQNVERLDFVNVAGASRGTLGNGNIFYAYSKQSRDSFKLEFEGALNNEVRLDNIVLNLLGGNSALSTEFRSLIVNRRTPDFTDAEVARLKAILNPSGAGLIGDTLENLYTYDLITYTHIVTSNNRDKLAGTMGGVYSLDANAKKIGFRRPNILELAASRFLSPNSQIPTVTNINIFLDNIELGTWVMQLSNGTGNNN